MLQQGAACAWPGEQCCLPTLLMQCAAQLSVWLRLPAVCPVPGNAARSQKLKPSGWSAGWLSAVRGVSCSQVSPHVQARFSCITAFLACSTQVALCVQELPSRTI